MSLNACNTIMELHAIFPTDLFALIYERYDVKDSQAAVCVKHERTRL